MAITAIKPQVPNSGEEAAKLTTDAVRLAQCIVEDLNQGSGWTGWDLHDAREKARELSLTLTALWNWAK